MFRQHSTQELRTKPVSICPKLLTTLHFSRFSGFRGKYSFANLVVATQSHGHRGVRVNHLWAVLTVSKDAVEECDLLTDFVQGLTARPDVRYGLTSAPDPDPDKAVIA